MPNDAGFPLRRADCILAYAGMTMMESAGGAAGSRGLGARGLHQRGCRGKVSGSGAGTAPPGIAHRR